MIRHMNTRLRMAVQSKGRLNEDTLRILAEAGMKVDAGKRTLLVEARNYPLEVLFLRDYDIPQTVADGVADAGIVGMNELAEQGVEADVVHQLGFGACRLSIAVPKEAAYTGVDWLNDKKIATSYPGILKRFLESRGVHAHPHVITGSVEIATGIGLADAIFDIVSSGSTLISNNLREVEVVMKSEAVLIAHPGLSDEKRQILDEMIFRFKALQGAAGKKYVLMNVPKGALDSVLHELSGIKSPTVMPLAQEGWCSVHTVLEEDSFWVKVGKLKEVGAQGILVLPIEKMVL